MVSCSPSSFYDFIQPAAGTVLAIVGDVSGKEIPEALEAGPMACDQVRGASAAAEAAP